MSSCRWFFFCQRYWIVIVSIGVEWRFRFLTQHIYLPPTSRFCLLVAKTSKKFIKFCCGSGQLGGSRTLFLTSLTERLGFLDIFTGCIGPTYLGELYLCNLVRIHLKLWIKLILMRFHKGDCWEVCALLSSSNTGAAPETVPLTFYYFTPTPLISGQSCHVEKF